jgi:hypothetical protein
MSFVTPLPHEVAATLPLLVLPPNRLRLLNPIQGLQALITLLLTHPGFAARSAQLAALMPNVGLRRDYQLLFLSLLPRAWQDGRPADPVALRERLEDTWRNPLVLRRWQRLARQLTAEQAETLVRRAVARGLAGKSHANGGVARAGHLAAAVKVAGPGHEGLPDLHPQNGQWNQKEPGGHDGQNANRNGQCDEQGHVESPIF